MLTLGLFHLSTTETVVDGCGRNSAGSMFFGPSSDKSRPGSRNAAEVIGRSSMLDSDPRAEDGGGVEVAGITTTVLVGDMSAIGDTAKGSRCLPM